MNRALLQTEIHKGLAAHVHGEGRPLFVLPYPHAAAPGSMADDPLVQVGTDAGFQTVTFDPPGTGRSSRSPEVDLDEMMTCSEETLAVLGLEDPVPVLGHSMSALCAFFFALRRPERVSHLVLIGTPPGSGLAIIRFRGMPFNWPPWDPSLWKSVVWGALLAAGWGNLAMHKRMVHLRTQASFLNQDLVSELRIEPGDRHRPAPTRDRWWYRIRNVRTIPRAEHLQPPTLLLVGRHDPQTPVAVSQALHGRIPGSQLVIFERSGHSPFLEEPKRFRVTLADFLNAPPPTRPLLRRSRLPHTGIVAEEHT